MTVVARGELWVNSSLDDIEGEKSWFGLVFASVAIYELARGGRLEMTVLEGS